MDTSKKAGIWMDHSSAHIIEYTGDPIETKNIESKFTHQEKEHSLGKSEAVMHNKQDHQQAEYYKELGNVIKGYNQVVLFGPTEAKVELLNLLRKDHRFEKIKIGIMQADKMTEKQQHAFVKDYYQTY